MPPQAPGSGCLAAGRIWWEDKYIHVARGMPACDPRRHGDPRLAGDGIDLAFDRA